MNTGKAGAFRFLQPAQSDLSKTILQQEQMNTIHQEKKEAKQKQQTQDNLNDLEDLGKINSGERTGYNHIDAAFIDAYNRKGGLVDQYVEAKKRLKNSNNTDAEAYGIIKNIEKYTSELSSMKQGFVKIASELQSGIAQGKYSAELNKGFLSNIDKIEKGGIFINTDNLAELNIENLGFDLNNDGLPEKINLKTFQDPRNFGVFESDFNINQFSRNVLDEKHITYEDKTDNGITTKISKGFNPKNELILKDDFYNTFGRDANSLTNAGKSYVIQNGLTVQQIKENPALYKQLIDDTASKYIKTRQVSDSKEVDQNAINARNRLAFEKKKYDDELANPKPKKPEKPYQYKVEATTEKDGKVKTVTNLKNQKATEFTGFSPFEILNSKGEKLKIEKILLSDSGEISFKAQNLSVRNEINKVKGKKKIELEKRLNIESQDKSDLDKIISILKFNDKKDFYDEMTKNIESKAGLKNNTQEPTTFDPTKF
jgi:hypothetical protein